MNFKNSPELTKFVEQEYRKINALSTEDYFNWLETASPETINRYNEYTKWLKELNKPPSLKQKTYKAIRVAYKFLKKPLELIAIAALITFKFLKKPLELIAIAALITLLIIVLLVGVAGIFFALAYFYKLNPFIGIIVGLFICILMSMILNEIE